MFPPSVCPAAPLQLQLSWTKAKTSRFIYRLHPANPLPTLTECSGESWVFYFLIHRYIQLCLCHWLCLTNDFFSPGPCVLWNSWRSLSMAASVPTQWPPRLELTWPRSWRNTPRCLLTMQALMSRCLESVCSFQRHPAALKHHLKPSNVRPTPFISMLHSCTAKRRWCYNKGRLLRNLITMNVQYSVFILFNIHDLKLIFWTPTSIISAQINRT